MVEFRGIEESGDVVVDVSFEVVVLSHCRRVAKAESVDEGTEYDVAGGLVAECGGKEPGRFLP